MGRNNYNQPGVRREEEVEETYEMLTVKYADTDKYSTPQLHLWSRMVAAEQHKSLDGPPPDFIGQKKISHFIFSIEEEQLEMSETNVRTLRCHHQEKY